MESYFKDGNNLNLSVGDRVLIKNHKQTVPLSICKSLINWLANKPIFEQKYIEKDIVCVVSAKTHS